MNSIPEKMFKLSTIEYISVPVTGKTKPQWVSATEKEFSLSRLMQGKKANVDLSGDRLVLIKRGGGGVWFR